MRFTTLALALFSATTIAIPIAPSQAILSLEQGQTEVSALITDVLASNIKAAQTDYLTVQQTLDGIGFFLDQITETTCVSNGPSTNATAVTSQPEVLQMLQVLQQDVFIMKADIGVNITSAAAAAWEGAQEALDSTYSYIFKSVGGNATSTATATAAAYT